MSWRDEPPTTKQLKYIADMCEMSEYPLPLFTGTTKGEASDYISRWVGIAHELIYNPHEDGGDRI